MNSLIDNCSYLNLFMLGLDIHIVFNAHFGIAYLLPKKKSKPNNMIKLALFAMHINITQNDNLSDLILELHGEDRHFKETEMATFTL